MPDVERQLVSKAVQAGTVEVLVRRGINGAHFHNDEHRMVFQTLVQHQRKYGAPPSREAVLAKHPTYKMDVVEDTTEYVIDEFIKQVQKRLTQAALVDVAGRMDEEGLDMIMMEHSRNIAEILPSARVAKLSEAKNRLTLLREQREKGRIPGFPLGIPSIDRTLLGVQGYELVTVAAYSNVGKSTMLIYHALAGYLASSDHRPLFISLEMEADEILRKMDAMAAKIQMSAIQSLELNDGQEKKYEEWAERCETAPHDIIVIDDIESATVDRIHAETMRYKPTAVFTDYVQLMEGGGDNSYSRVGNAAKGLKRIARMTGVAQFTAAQTTRQGAKEGVTSDNIADSIEIFRSSDIMIGLERDDDLNDQNQARIKLIKSRRTGLANTLINWNFKNMDFSEVEDQRFQTKQKDEEKAPDAFSPDSRPPLADNPFAIAAIEAETTSITDVLLAGENA